MKYLSGTSAVTRVAIIVSERKKRPGALRVKTKGARIDACPTPYTFAFQCFSGCFLLRDIDVGCFQLKLFMKARYFSSIFLSPSSHLLLLIHSIALHNVSFKLGKTV